MHFDGGCKLEGSDTRRKIEKKGIRTIQLLRNIRRKFGLNNWLKEDVAIPVRRRHTGAAPHTDIAQPCFPIDGSMANECS